MKHLEVVAAIIMHNSKILCVQRDINKYSYISEKFEFPGGKMEADETKQAAISREVWEELRMEITPIEEICTVEHQYPDFNITMHGLLCACKNTDLELREHISFQWLDVSELRKLDWAAADVPIVKKIEELAL